MPPVSSTQGTPELVQQIREAQTMFFDKAANYIRLVVGLGYGGFFAVWAGTRENLSPKYVVLSAASMMVSVMLFIAFEVIEAGTVSHLNLALAKTFNSAGQYDAANGEKFLKALDTSRRFFAKAWAPVFYASVITGFGGAVILAAGFIRTLWVLW